MKPIKTIPLFFIIIFAQVTKGQDTISMRSGETIVAKVSDVGVTEITYKKWGHLDGPNYSILKSDVSSIKYPDGSKDVFKLPPSNASIPPPANPPSNASAVPPAVPATQNNGTMTQNNQPPAAMQTNTSLAALAQYLNAITNATQTNYTMADSTVDDMSKLRICPLFYMGNALEYTGQVDATYTDYHNFMIGGNMVLDGSYGVDGTIYLIKSNKMKMTTIPFNYQGEYHTHTYAVVQHNTEKINYLGLHIGYAQKRLQEATMAWEEYYGIWGGQAQDITETNSGANNSNLVAQPAPMYSEIAIGPQYVWASSYKAILNDGSGLVAKRRMMAIIGLDALIYPTTPTMNSTYDSLALYKAAGSFGYYNLPSSIFNSAGVRLHAKFYWGWATNNYDWGLDWELSVEDNLAGVGFTEQIGLYFGL